MVSFTKTGKMNRKKIIWIFISILTAAIAIYALSIALTVMSFAVVWQDRWIEEPWLRWGREGKGWIMYPSPKLRDRILQWTPLEKRWNGAFFSEEAGFTVLQPIGRGLIERVETIETDFGTIEAHVFEARVSTLWEGELVYQVSYCDYPPNFLEIYKSKFQVSCFPRLELIQNHVVKSSELEEGVIYPGSIATHSFFRENILLETTVVLVDRRIHQRIYQISFSKKDRSANSLRHNETIFDPIVGSSRSFFDSFRVHSANQE